MVRGVAWIAASILALFGAISRNPKDRVLWCQTLAMVSLIAAVVITRLEKLSDSAVVLALIPFVSFTSFAGYFGLVNWLRRRRNTG
jgi:multisubunit Na+/H+ antiporter MnhF subunit